MKLNNLKLMKKMGLSILSGYNNTCFINIVLYEIHMTKKLFVAQVELGEEVVVPHILQQKNLCQNFRFYDPILSIIDELCSDAKRNLFFQREQQLIRMCFEKEKNFFTGDNHFFMSSKEREEHVENEPSLEETLNLHGDFQKKMGGISLKHMLINTNMIDYLKS